MLNEFQTQGAASVNAILAELGDRWTIEPAKYDHNRSITRDDGVRILFYFDFRGRVEVTPCTPMRNGSQTNVKSWAYGTETPRYTYDPSRPAATVARAVTRKVIDPYEAIFATIKERQREDTETEAARQSLLGRMREATGAKPYGNGGEYGAQTFSLAGAAGYGNAYGDLTVHPYARADATLRSLSPDQAVSLAAWAADNLVAPK